MKKLNEERGVTFLFSTHDPRLLEYVKRIVSVEDGRVVKDDLVKTKHLQGV
jgi:putative ABC transport system ATP-binding protein